MTWALVCVASALLVVAAFSRLLTGTPVTPAMVFLLLGVVFGPEVFDGIDFPPEGEVVKVLAEATLAIVLFSDASRIKLAVLRRESEVPLRLLGIGLPLTIAGGALVAILCFPELSISEALILAVLLAPTDAALGQAVVSEPRLPSRIRQGLNVESGLNDGICVPLLFIVLAAGEAQAGEPTDRAITILAEEIGYGVLGGVAAGLVLVAVMALGRRRQLVDEAWLPVIPVAGAALAYGVAAALGGSGFIAAFLAGTIFGGLATTATEEEGAFSEQLGGLLNGLTFLAFGAVLLGPSLGDLSWTIAAYAVLSLTVVRVLPVALALLGTHARRPTVAFVGWFGPRGLASIVFAVVVVEEADLPHLDTILLTTYATVGLSVLLHGLTAAPLADRYARWYASHPRGALPAMESVPAEEHPVRSARAGAVAADRSG